MTKRWTLRQLLIQRKLREEMDRINQEIDWKNYQENQAREARERAEKLEKEQKEFVNG